MKSGSSGIFRLCSVGLRMITLPSVTDGVYQAGIADHFDPHPWTHQDFVRVRFYFPYSVVLLARKPHVLHSRNYTIIADFSSTRRLQCGCRPKTCPGLDRTLGADQQHALGGNYYVEL